MVGLLGVLPVDSAAATTEVKNDVDGGAHRGAASWFNSGHHQS
jgi:hypothetical protein